MRLQATVLGNTRFLQLVERCYTTTQMLGADWITFLCERIRCSFELNSAVDETVLHVLTVRCVLHQDATKTRSLHLAFDALSLSPWI